MNNYLPISDYVPLNVYYFDSPKDALIFINYKLNPKPKYFKCVIIYESIDIIYDIDFIDGMVLVDPYIFKLASMAKNINYIKMFIELGVSNSYKKLALKYANKTQNNNIINYLKSVMIS